MPLTYVDRGEAKSGTQLDIMCGNARVGFLWKAVLSRMTGGDAHWAWTWHSGPADGSEKDGTADNIELAKGQSSAWLEAAQLHER